MNNLDVVIIGSGPAGIASAIYLQRANKNIVIIEKASPGGQMVNTNIIENYPGFNNIDGASLATKMYEQINNLKIPYKYGNVLKIEKLNDLYKVVTDKEEYITKKVILAIGRKPRKLDIENIDSYVGKGISYCATCDGYLYKDMDVAVVGAGDTAYEETIYLTNICKHIYLLNRSENVRASSILQKEILTKSNIEIIKNIEVLSLIEQENKLVGINTTKGKLDISALFIFIGQEPNEIKIDNLVTDNGYILVNNKMQTNLPGIYACGDIIKKDYYQITLAIGEGTLAALNIIKELN